MAHYKDYIPSKDPEFDQFFSNLNRYVGEKTGGNVPEWTFIPSDARTNLNDLYTAWDTAYTETKVPHTPVQTEAKNDAKTAAVAAIRPFVNQYLRFPPVTNEDRTAMGIPNKDTTPTPVPPPADQAEADLLYPGIHLIELKIRALPANRPDAGKGDYGVRIYYGVLGDATATDKFRLASAPASGDDLPHSVFTRKRKYRFDFPEGDRGKQVYFCLRYENSKGESGPWGPIIQAIIP
jgi:hypothetical protein